MQNYLNIKNLSEEDKDALGYIDQCVLFINYLNKTKKFTGTLSDFFNQKGITEEHIKRFLKYGWFSACRVKGKIVYDMCWIHKISFTNYNWINSMNTLDESIALWKKIKAFKIQNNYSWQHAMYQYLNQ